MIKATGQEILDALEFGAKNLPSEDGGFLQVAGISYEIHTYLKSSIVTDKNGMFEKVNGEYRVKKVKINGEVLDPKQEYTLINHNYLIKDQGDGFSMFSDNEILLDEFILNYEAIINYINNEYQKTQAFTINPMEKDELLP